MHIIATVQNAWWIMNKPLDVVLSEWYPDGNFTEEELWDAIAEVNEVDVNEIMDQDLTLFI